ncbi:MAG: carboxypeptidase regulatory-like domain-containing protein, partial [Mucilaginibacter sp.]
MRSFVLGLGFLLLTATQLFAQNGIQVRGSVIDTAKLSVPGASVKLTSDQGDSTLTAADVDGKFSFPSVKGKKIRITVTSIGFEAIAKRYSLESDSGLVVLDPIIMNFESNQLGQVTITAAANPVVLKEDTVEYKVSSYKVRDNAPIEDVLRKLPGVDVDKDGNVSAQGQQITKVRLNGKDFYGGDLQAATKNLPADIIESIQIVDDYGDQANLTGIRSGEPTKILNINVRKDKNYGYSLQATAGDGSDALPKDPGVTNENRYLGTLNFFKFKDQQQIAVLGSLNNTNVNTFSFTSPTSGGFGGNFGGGGGGGGGRGNALRGASGQTTGANGITDAKSIGINFRDEIGKKLSVYGNYSFSDNSTFTNSQSLQINRLVNPSTSTTASNQTRNPLNHRFDFNMEYSPDSMNYIKINPSFSYSRTNSFGDESTQSIRTDTADNLAYTINSLTNTTAPNFNINGLFNHKFNNRGRNFNLNVSYSTSKNDQFDNPIYNYTVGEPTTPLNQRINTNSRTSTWGTRFSYIEPLSKLS